VIEIVLKKKLKVGKVMHCYILVLMLRRYHFPEAVAGKEMKHVDVYALRV